MTQEEIELKLVALVNDKLAHLEREMGETRSVLSEIKEWTRIETGRSCQ